MSITKIFPPAILISANIGFQREVITFVTINLFFYEHKVLFDTVVFNKVPGINVVNVIEIIIKQIPQVNWFSGIHTAAFLRVIEVQFFASEFCLWCIGNLFTPISILVFAFFV